MPGRGWRAWAIRLAVGVLCTALAMKIEGASAASGAGRSPPDGAQHVAVPDDAARQQALRLIQRVFAADYAERSPTSRRALSAKLLAQGMATRDDVAARFVLLSEAADAAAQAGDARLAERAMTAVEKTFEIDAVALRAAVLESVVMHSSVREQYAQAARCCLDAAESAAIADRYEPGIHLQALAQTAAAKAARPDLLSRAIALGQEIPQLQARSESARRAIQSLSDNPDDPAANTQAGQYWCFVCGNWKAGLGMLAKADDAALREAAQSDLAGPDESSSRVEVGHRWWAIAQTRSGLMRRHIQARAAMWYWRAAPQLSGLNRTLVQQRLAAWDAAEAARADLVPGLHAALFDSERCERQVLSRIDSQIDFDWGTEAAGPGVPRDHFSVRWSGQLRVPRAGRYDFVVIANSRAKLCVDDQVLLDEPDLSRKRTGQRISVDLREGFCPLEVEFADATGTAKIRLLWAIPDTLTEQPLPPSALYHESPIP